MDFDQPEFDNPDSRELRVADILLERERLGADAPSIEEYKRRNPDLAVDLEKLALADELRATYYIPDRLGQFQVLDEIGAGGMGIVYRALQEPFGRTVAVKTIWGSIQAEEARSRFLREQEVLATLHQSNIVPVFAAGEETVSNGDTLQYFAMPYLQGATLRDILRLFNSQDRAENGNADTTLGEIATRLAASTVCRSDTAPGSAPAAPKSVQENATVRVAADQRLDRDMLEILLRVIAQLAIALKHAHERDVLHCDIKPSNIMVDGSGTPYLIDFGLAGLVTASDGVAAEAEGARQPRATAIAGTPMYMAPEQYGGQAYQQTDIWSLGVVLYEVLAGKLPFRSEQDIVRNSPEAPTKAWKSPDHSLDAICFRALEKDPQDRYQSAADLADDIGCWLRGDRVAARNYGPLEVLLHWCGRYRAAASLIGVLFVATLVVTILASSLRTSLSSETTAKNKADVDRIAAVAAEEKAREAEGKAEESAREAREAEVRALTLRAQSHILVGDMALAANRPFDAQSHHRQAAEFMDELKLDTLPADIAAHSAFLSAPPPLISFDTPKEALTNISVSADGRRVAVSTVAKAFSMFDAQTGSRRATYEGHTDAVLCHAFSPDGKHLVSGSADKTVRIWDAVSGELLHTFGEPTHHVTSLDLSADGKTIVAGTGVRWQKRGGLSLRFSPKPFTPGPVMQATVHVFDFAARRERMRLSGHEGTISCVDISPDSKLAITGSEDMSIRLWDLENEEMLYRFNETASPVGDAQAGQSGQDEQPFDRASPIQDVVIAPDSRLAVAFSVAGQAVYCDLLGGESQTVNFGQLDQGTGLLMRARVRADFQRMLISSRDGNARLIDPISQQALQVFTGEGLGTRIGNVQFLSPHVALTGSDGQIFVWGTDPDPVAVTLQGSFLDQLGRPMPMSFCMSRDGTLALGCGSDRVVRVWDMDSGRLIRVLRGDAGPSVASIGYSPDSRLAITGGQQVAIWDVIEGNRLATLEGHEAGVLCSAISPDNTSAITGALDGTARIWDLRTRKTLHILNHPRDEEEGSDTTVQLEVVQVDGKQFLLPPDKDRQPELPRISEVVFFPNGRRVLTKATDAIIWDAQSGQELMTLELPEESENAVNAGSNWTCSNDGSRLLSWRELDSAKNEIVLWNAETGAKVRSFPLVSPNGLDILSMAISPDGNYLTAVRQDATIFVFDLNDGRQLHASSPQNVRYISAQLAHAGSKLLVKRSDGRVQVHDYGRPKSYREQEALVLQAIAKLRLNNDDGASLATLGRWYLLRGQSEWAIDLLERAKDRDVDVDADLARAFWRRDSWPRQDWKKVRELLGADGTAGNNPIARWSFERSYDELLDSAATGASAGHLQASLDGASFVISSDKQPARLVSIQDDRIRQQVVPGFVGTPLAISSDGSTLAGRLSPTTIGIVHRETRSLKHQLEIPPVASGAVPLILSSDAKWFAAGPNGNVLLWDLSAAEAKLVRDVPAPRNLVTQARQRDKQLDAWLKRLAQIGKTMSPRVECLALAPAAKRLAVAYSLAGDDNRPGYLQLLDSTDGQVLDELLCEPAKISSLAISRNGEMLAAGAVDGSLRFLSSVGDKLQVVKIRREHSGGVTSLAFSADTTQLLSGGSDHTLRQWSLAEDYAQQKELWIHDAAVQRAFYLQDNRILSVDDDGVILLWKQRNVEMPR